MFRKLKRVYSYSDFDSKFVRDLKKEFPELKDIKHEDFCDRFSRLKVYLYTEEKEKVSVWTRLTLPIALIVMLFMFIGLPFNYIISGEWGYKFNEKAKLANWFKALGLYR